MKKMTPKERKDITWDRTLRRPHMMVDNPYMDLIYCNGVINQVKDENSIKRLNNDMVLQLAHVVEILKYRTRSLPIGRTIESIPMYNDLIMDMGNVTEMLMVAKHEMHKDQFNKKTWIIAQNACTIIDHFIMIYDGVKTRPKAKIINLNEKRKTLELKDRKRLPRR